MKLFVMEYKPPLKASVLAAILGVVFIVIAIFAHSLPEPPPLAFRVMAGVLGFAGVAACVWNFTVGRRLARNLKVLSGGLRLTDSKVILPHTMRITPGKLTLRKMTHRSGKHTRVRVEQYLDYTGETRETSEIDIASTKGDVGGIVGRVYPEWIVLPVFEVSEPEYKISGGSVVFCIVPKFSHEVMISRGSLRVSYDRDFAQLTMDTSRDTIHGKITYMKPPNGVSRSVRVELEAKYRIPKTRLGIIGGEGIGLRVKIGGRLVLRKTLAELKNSGTLEFNYQLPRVKEPRVIVGVHTQLEPKRIVKTLGLEPPVIFGSGWELVEARIKLVLDIPRHRDVIDEAKIIIKPIIELE